MAPLDSLQIKRSSFPPNTTGHTYIVGTAGPSQFPASLGLSLPLLSAPLQTTAPSFFSGFLDPFCRNVTSALHLLTHERLLDFTVSHPCQ